MIIAGSIRDGKKLYNIGKITVGDYRAYSEMVKKNVNPIEALKFLIKKSVFRTIECRLFGKVIFKFKLHDFDLNVIPVEMFAVFQTDFFKIIFGDDFFQKAVKGGDLAEGHPKEGM